MWVCWTDWLSCATFSIFSARSKFSTIFSGVIQLLNIQNIPAIDLINCFSTDSAPNSATIDYSAIDSKVHKSSFSHNSTGRIFPARPWYTKCQQISIFTNKIPLGNVSITLFHPNCLKIIMHFWLQIVDAACHLIVQLRFQNVNTWLVVVFFIVRAIANERNRFEWAFLGGLLGGCLVL